MNRLDKIIEKFKNNKIIVLIILFCIIIIAIGEVFDAFSKIEFLLPSCNDSLDNKHEKVKFVVIRSGDLEYTRDILYGFRKTLDDHFFKIGLKFDIYDKCGSSEPAEQRDQYIIFYNEIIDLILERDEYNYFITIGTQASIALNEYFIEKNIDKPIIFLGVTDPVDAKLVLRLKNRKDERNITGVSYCEAVENIPAEIHRIFPKNKLVFIYNTGYPQDEIFAARIKRMRLYSDKKLSIKSLDNSPTLKDFDDPSAIYFSWYTFEQMFETPKGVRLFKKRNIVASTLAHVKPDDLASLAIASDDKKIGEEGANLVIKIIKNKLRLGEIDIIEPKLNFYVNCKTVYLRRLYINKEALKSAKFKFNCN